MLIGLYPLKCVGLAHTKRYGSSNQEVWGSNRPTIKVFFMAHMYTKVNMYWISIWKCTYTISLMNACAIVYNKRYIRKVIVKISRNRELCIMIQCRPECCEALLVEWSSVWVLHATRVMLAANQGVCGSNPPTDESILSWVICMQ